MNTRNTSSKIERYYEFLKRTKEFGIKKNTDELFYFVNYFGGGQMQKYCRLSVYYIEWNFEENFGPHLSLPYDKYGTAWLEKTHSMSDKSFSKLETLSKDLKWGKGYIDSHIDSASITEEQMLATFSLEFINEKVRDFGRKFVTVPVFEPITDFATTSDTGSMEDSQKSTHTPTTDEGKIYCHICGKECNLNIYIDNGAEIRVYDGICIESCSEHCTFLVMKKFEPKRYKLWFESLTDLEKEAYFPEMK